MEEDLPAHLHGTTWTWQVHRGEPREGIHSKVQISVGFTFLFRHKERWKSKASPRLPGLKRRNHQERIPTTPYKRYHRSFTRCQHLHQTWCASRIQQCSHQERRWVESSVHHPQWTIRTNSHVLWIVQRTCNIPKHDERHLSGYVTRRVDSHLHGWHSHLLRQSWNTPPTNTESFTKAPRARPISQGGEMRIWQTRGRIPWIHHPPRSRSYGPYKTQGNQRLGTTKNGQASPSVLRVCQLLSPVYPRLFEDGTTLDRTDKKGHPVCLVPRLPNHIRYTQETVYWRTNSSNPKPRQTVSNRMWRFQGRNRCSLTTARTRWTVAPMCLSIKILHSSWTELPNLWSRTTSHHSSPRSMATLLTRITTSCRSALRS